MDPTRPEHPGPTQLLPVSAPVDAPEHRFVPRPRPAGSDRVFSSVTLGAGLVVLVLLGLVGIFLAYRAYPALADRGWAFFTTTRWRLDVRPRVFGVLGLLWGTVVVALIAMVFAVPISILSALFLSVWVPAGPRRFLIGLVDLLAALPSLIYGLWGFIYLQPRVIPLSAWLHTHLGWVPIFDTHRLDFGSSFFIAGLVVSLMVLPITTSVAREAFSSAPAGECEAALALGGSRWGMVRAVVLPFGRGGVVGGVMLGLGRALGETIAVTLLLPQVPKLSAQVLESGGGTISGFIVQQFGGDDFSYAALLAAGLVLFVLTLVTNFAASVIIGRSRSGAGVEA